MNLSLYLAYIKKVWGEVKLISSRYGISRFWVLCDYSWCLIRHGCLINQYTRGHFHLMTELIRRNAFTQRRVEKVIKKYNASNYIHLLENKNEFNTFFKNYIKRDWLYLEEMTLESFSKLFKSHEELFLKPLDDMEGHGIRIVITRDNTCEQLYEELKGKKIIIETIIKQHEKLILGNKSVNSARVLTVIDSKGKAHVIRAGLRAGVGNAIVDNYSAGGVLYEIDVETGIIDHKGIQGNNYNIIFHPGTNKCMLGYKLPNWDVAMVSVKKAAELIPQCRFVGWDVAFTPDGIELIEGNHNPGLFTMESLGTPAAYAETMKILKG